MDVHEAIRPERPIHGRCASRVDAVFMCISPSGFAHSLCFLTGGLHHRQRMYQPFGLDWFSVLKPEGLSYPLPGS